VGGRRLLPGGGKGETALFSATKKKKRKKKKKLMKKDDRPARGEGTEGTNWERGTGGEEVIIITYEKVPVAAPWQKRR